MSSSASPPSVYPPWTKLPSEVTANILQRLGTVERLQSAQFVCATWWKVCQNPALWRIIKIVIYGAYSDEKLTMMCRRAVDLSRGQLISLTIAYFGNDGLLHYIADRSSHLQGLTLAYCPNISPASLVEAGKKLKELEELHLIMPWIPAGDIEAVGNACPMLKSFTFNNRPIPPLLQQLYSIAGSITNNEQALAIAKTMPNLHHLVLFANALNNEGLQAILDACPRLESLDLRQCFGVHLRGRIRKRCCEKIKLLRLPADSIADYEWDPPGIFRGIGFDDDFSLCYDEDDDYEL